MHPADPPEPRFAPFIRSDQYGHLGLAPQTPLHYLQLGLLAVTLVPLKIVGAHPGLRGVLQGLPSGSNTVCLTKAAQV